MRPEKKSSVRKAEQLINYHLHKLHLFSTSNQAGHCYLQENGGGKGKIRVVDGEVFLTTLPEATLACRKLIRCGCKKECRGHCK